MVQDNRNDINNAKHNKRLNIVILLLVLLCFLSISFGVAFFTKSVTTNNVIRFGDVKIKLHETYIKNNQEFVVDTGKNEDILKVSNSERNIRIENVGNNPAFIRVSLDMIEQTVSGEKLIPNSSVGVTAVSDSWVYSDGWYYYKQSLEPGEKTEALLTTITFDINEVTSNHKDSLFNLDITAQGVQSENNCDNVLDVVGWPQEV